MAGFGSERRNVYEEEKDKKISLYYAFRTMPVCICADSDNAGG